MSPSLSRQNGYTLVELLVGMALSVMVMSAVLSSYIFLGRNFTRALGLSSANRPSLESQSRRTLAYFENDARMASGFAGTLAATSVTFTFPAAISSSSITYTYTSAATTINSTSVPAQCLVRYVGTGTPLILYSNVISCAISYYDLSGNPYTSYTNYLPGIKQISISFTAQGGSSTNATLTQIQTATSPRILLRNRPPLQ